VGYFFSKNFFDATLFDFRHPNLFKIVENCSVYNNIQPVDESKGNI
jgi:hypothetical protein